jgi:hypothetical protein
MDKNKMTKNLDFVSRNLEQFKNIYLNKYILVVEEEVVGSFDTYEAAADQGINNYGTEGDFLVYYVTESIPVNFVSSALI